MAGEDRVLAGGARHIDFRPTRRATGIGAGCRRRCRDADHGRRRERRLFRRLSAQANSYDLGVDIELADACSVSASNIPA